MFKLFKNKKLIKTDEVYEYVVCKVLIDENVNVDCINGTLIRPNDEIIFGKVIEYNVIVADYLFNLFINSSIKILDYSFDINKDGLSLIINKKHDLIIKNIHMNHYQIKVIKENNQSYLGLFSKKDENRTYKIYGDNPCLINNKENIYKLITFKRSIFDRDLNIIKIERLFVKETIIKTNLI